MRFLKSPTKKKQDPIIPWEQKSFTGLYKDTQASEIPDGGVAKLVNGLLFGDGIHVRPGSEKLSDLVFPVSTTKSFTDTLEKVGDIVTDSDNGFIVGMEGNFLVWPDGTSDLIIKMNGAGEVQVDNDTVQTAISASYREKANGVFFTRKGKLVLLHIGTKLYWSGLDFSAWTNIPVFKGQDLGNVQSSFVEKDDVVYIFANNIYSIDLSYINDPVTVGDLSLFQINLPSPPNTITANTDSGTDDEGYIQPVSEEDLVNRFGRRYIFTLTRFYNESASYPQKASRIDGTAKILKESGPNTYPASNDYKDYAESWRVHSNDNADNPFYEYTMGVADISEATSHYLYSWQITQLAFAITIGAYTRDVVIQPSTFGVETWERVAACLQDGIRNSFPEYPYFTVSYSSDSKLIFLSGDMNVSVTAIASPSSLEVLTWDATAGGLLDAVTYEAQRGWNVIGKPHSNQALQLPYGQYGYTHFSIYSTLTLGPEYRGGSGGSNSENYFVWSRDIPVVKVFKLLQAWTSFIIKIPTDGSSGEFTDDDLGCIIHTQDGLDNAQITAVIGPYEVNVDIEANSSMGIAIGATDICYCSKSGNIITKSLGASFTSNDVGKLVYWNDGSYDIITSYTDATHLVTEKSGTKTNLYMTMDPTGRCFNDSVTDLTLESRLKAFPLQNRFWNALPSSDIGVIAPGFFVSAKTNEPKAYYSQMVPEYKYLVGHYYPEFQYLDIDDAIRHISVKPDLVCLYGANSTWNAKTNVPTTIAEKNVGELLAILPGLTQVDSQRGVRHRSSIVEYGRGLSFVLTSDGSIRAFNGYQYDSENRLYDKNGRPLIRKDVLSLKEQIVLYYEPNLYGLMIFGLSETFNSNYAGQVSTISDKCFRYAIENHQGIGYAEIEGDFTFPELNVGLLTVTDSYNNRYTVAFDFRTGKPFILSTKIGIEDYPMRYVDKYDENDTEISGYVRLREHIAPEEQFELKYLEEYWFLRPQDESLKSATGHDSYGFRTQQSLEIRSFTNGDSDEVSESHITDPKTTVLQPYRIEARRIQTELAWGSSELIITGHKAIYTVNRARYNSVSDTLESTWQNQLSKNLVLWLTRNYGLARNLASGETKPSSTMFTGPDNQLSAMFNNTIGYSYSNIDATVNRGYLFGLKINSTAVGVLFQELDGIDEKIKIYVDNEHLMVDYEGVNKIDITLAIGGWYLILVSNSSNTLTVKYRDNTGLLGTETSALTLSAFSGDMVVLDSCPHYLFGLRMYDTIEVSNEAFEYYGRDGFDFQFASTEPLTI